MPGVWIVTALMGLAASVRVVAWFQKAVLFDDGPLFLAMADAIRDGDWPAVLGHDYHPFYSALIAVATELGVGPEAAAVGISIAGGSLAVGFLYGFICDSFGRVPAAIGAFLLALHPRAVAYSSDVQSEGVYMAFFLAAVWMAWRGLQRKPSFAMGAATGVLVGLAYLVRPEGLGLLGVALVGAGVAGISRRVALGPLLAWSVALVAVAFLTAAPYLVGLQSERGEWSLTPKKSLSTIVPFLETAVPEVGAPLAESRRRAADRIGRPTPPRRAHAQAVAERPSARSGGEVLLDWGSTSLSALRYDLLFLVFLGIASCWGRPGPRAGFVSTIAILYLVALYGLAWNAGYVSRRHALIPLLPLFGYAAEGVLHGGRLLGGVMDRYRSSRSQVPGRWYRVGVAAVLLAYVAVALPANLSPRRTESAAVRQAAEWLREEAPALARVAAPRLRIAYYAGASFVPMPSPGDPQGVLHLRESGADYLVVEEEEFGHLSPIDEAPSEFVEIYRVEAQGRVGIVLEVIPAP